MEEERLLESLEESCNVATDMEESVEIVTANKGMSFVNNPELEQSKARKSQQIFMSNFNNQKRKRNFNYEVPLITTPTKKENSRILKLS